MSYLKFNSNQFLEKQELDRWWKFVNDDGYRKHLLDNTYSYGIIREKEDTNFDNFRVKEGTNNGTIKIDRKSYALDKYGNLIVKNVEDNIPVTDNNNWYWIKISHKFSPIEKGLVNIDGNGNLTGTGTEFTKVLRGGTNVPSVIAFTNSLNNIQEYTVLEVIDDENAILSGVSGAFAGENNLNYKVIGSFTPDYTPDPSQKDIFQYDSIEFEQVFESPQGTQTIANKPSRVLDEEFFIARVKRNGNSLIIQDKRNEFWRYKADYELNKDLTSDNPLIGIEAIKWDSKYSTRTDNIVEVGWGFRTDSYSYSASLDKISISGGFGGNFEGVADFTNGDFDGWRVYFIDGTYSKILQSTTNGSQIDLILDNFDPAKLSSGDLINIVPDVEEIEIYVEQENSEPNNELIYDYFQFNIENAFAKLHILVPADGSQKYSYQIQYRYKNHAVYSQWEYFPDDTKGFPSENKHDEKGFLINPNSYTPSPLNNGKFTLTAHPNSYYSRINAVDTGEVFGVNRKLLDNGSPYINLEVGNDALYQIIDGESIDFNTNHYINLSTKEVIPFNRFILDFRGIDITKNANDFYITQDFDGSGIPAKNQAEVEIGNIDDSGSPFTIKIQVKPYNEWITIGEYEVTSGDTATTVANELIANGSSTGINDQNILGYSAVLNVSTITITEEPFSDLAYTKYNTDIQVTYEGSQNNTNANVLSNFQGKEVLFSLDNNHINQMSKNDCCFIAYVDNNNNWFLESYQLNRDTPHVSQTTLQLGENITAAAADERVLNLNEYKDIYKVDLQQSPDGIAAIRNYPHKEGEAITLFFTNYDSTGPICPRLGSANAGNIASTHKGYLSYDPLSPCIFEGDIATLRLIDGIWYIESFHHALNREINELEDDVSENQSQINDLQSNKVDKSSLGVTSVNVTLKANTNQAAPPNATYSGFAPVEAFLESNGFLHLQGYIKIVSGFNSGDKLFSIDNTSLPTNYTFVLSKLEPIGEHIALDIHQNGDAYLNAYGSAVISNGDIISLNQIPPVRKA